jgi:hypothetical protein
MPCSELVRIGHDALARMRKAPWSVLLIVAMTSCELGSFDQLQYRNDEPRACSIYSQFETPHEGGLLPDNGYYWAGTSPGLAGPTGDQYPLLLTSGLVSIEMTCVRSTWQLRRCGPTIGSLRSGRRHERGGHDYGVMPGFRVVPTEDVLPPEFTVRASDARAAFCSQTALRLEIEHYVDDATREEDAILAVWTSRAKPAPLATVPCFMGSPKNGVLEVPATAFGSYHENDVQPGSWYVTVQAMDLAGHLSEPVELTVDLAPGPALVPIFRLPTLLVVYPRWDLIAAAASFTVLGLLVAALVWRRRRRRAA